jgi:hypothetical protein
MINSSKLKEILVRHKRIIPILVAIVAIAAYMIPAHIASAAISGNVQQAITQSNTISASNNGKYGGAFADNNFQSNTASNSAFVSIVSGGGSSGGGISGSGNVRQAITQTNSITALNTGDFGTASASGNTQSNTATNTANVHLVSGGSGGSGGVPWDGKFIGSSGNNGGISGSGNVHQSITQSNDIQASNSGSSGSASADNNHQSNTATNTASVHISNHGSHNHGGGYKYSGGNSKGVTDSGNVIQAIKQKNSVSASNSGDHGTASASGNTLTNTATNTASVHG